MAVYLTMTVLVLAFSVFVANAPYAEPLLRGKRSVGTDRQQAINQVSAFGCFVLMAAVSACRIAVGNDYWVYRENFKRIYMGREVASEPGFNFVVYWMQKIFGYDNYLPIFGLFSVVTAAFMVKALKDQAVWFFGSMFLLLCSGYYFQSLNSVRYYFAIAVVLYAAKYVTCGEYLKFAAWILFAALFHKSVLIVLPGYLAAYFLSGKRIRAWMAVPAGILVASLLFGQSIYRKIIFWFYPYYEASDFDQSRISVVNVGMGICCFVLAVLCARTITEERRELKFYLWLNGIGLLVNLCGSFIPEVTRIGNYFRIAQVFLIPSLLYYLPKGKKKVILTAGTLLAFALYFAFFLRGADDTSIRILPYRNWIFD